MALQGKVKNALDEVRILVLGGQVLLGFQFRAFFEPGFDRLEAPAQGLMLLALACMLTTLCLLFCAPARHCLVEHGNDSERFHRFTMITMRSALLPFAAGLALAVGIAANRIGGELAGTVIGGALFLTALAGWYGWFAHHDRKQHAHPEDAVEKTKLEHRVVQVLTETRVVLPGAQALLGFQLAITLMEAFDKLPRGVRLLHLASLCLIALMTVVLMAPAAYHRIVERGEDTERFVRFASRMVLLALGLLAPGLAAELYVVLVKTGLEAAALPSALALLVVCYAGWFGAMLLFRRSRSARPLLHPREAS